jgi:hypothetical protein
MSKCFSCGQTFNGTTQELLRLFKRQHESYGIERYFYRLNANSDLKIVKKDQFKYIFENEIKPNLKNGAEYAHISEVK